MLSKGENMGPMMHNLHQQLEPRRLPPPRADVCGASSEASGSKALRANEAAPIKLTELDAAKLTDTFDKKSEAPSAGACGTGKKAVCPLNFVVTQAASGRIRI